MIVRNARVFDEKKSWVQRDLYIDGKFFSEHSTGGGEIDATGLYAIPGLIDLHLHGAMEREFANAAPDDIAEILRYEARNGVTAAVPTTLTMPEDALATACRRLARVHVDNSAEIVGIHLEGPFVSARKLGAQNPAYAALPDEALFRHLQTASGNAIKILSLAPELDGAIELIQKISGGVLVSLAHTEADYETARRAYAAGARHTTHLYNAMPPFHHREPGVVGAAFDAPGVTVELICDGVHVHPAVVRATFALFGPDRVVLVSDSMMATGMPDGKYEIGGLPVEVANGRATLANDDTIAGSVANLMDCLRSAVREAHIPLETAVRAATVNPARALGLLETRGSITPGKIADLVLLDESLEIQSVLLQGHTVV